MRLTRRQTAVSDGIDILFPLLECWNPMTKVATIAAEVNRKRVLCRISTEVLQQKFPESEGEPMLVVAQNRLLIQAAARRLIESEAYEDDGSIVIRLTDI
jgi:hypothetical protein